MTVEWSNDKVIEFLEILRTEPCLWDLRVKSYKNRASQNDAWRRIIDLLPFKATVEEMKKKKESLMGYYRTHLNKFKKSLKSRSGKNNVYSTNWFAYETMDSFLRDVYESNCTLSTETNNYSESHKRSEGINYRNENSQHLCSVTEESLQNVLGKNTINLKANKSYQDFGGKRQLIEDLPTEIRVNRDQLDKSFENIKEKKDDEYELFGRLISSKIKTIRNPNTADILMNDIHNLVFRTCMADRNEQQPRVPKVSRSLSSFNITFSSSPDRSSNQSSPDRSPSLSPQN